MRYQPGDRVIKLKGNCIGCTAIVESADDFTVRIRYEHGADRLRDSTYPSYIELYETAAEQYDID